MYPQNTTSSYECSNFARAVFPLSCSSSTSTKVPSHKLSYTSQNESFYGSYEINFFATQTRSQKFVQKALLEPFLKACNSSSLTSYPQNMVSDSRTYFLFLFLSTLYSCHIPFSALTCPCTSTTTKFLGNPLSFMQKHRLCNFVYFLELPSQ